MYAKGMMTRQISKTIEDIYGFETSEGFISDVTDKILPQIEDWQNCPLDEVYPILFIDAIHYSVRDNGVIRKLAAYMILEINTASKKEVLTIRVGDNKSSKYWLSVLNELKNRGGKDILILCADGLSGIKEASAAAFKDVTAGRWYSSAVKQAYVYGLILGKAANSYEPQSNLTIAEALTLAAKLHSYGSTGSYEVPPVPDGIPWYKNVVNYCFNNNIIQANEFTGRYNNKATRAEVAHIFANVYGEGLLPKINKVTSLPDVRATG